MELRGDSLESRLPCRDQFRSDTAVDIESHSHEPDHGISSSEKSQAEVSLAGPISILRVIGIPTSKRGSKLIFYAICSVLWLLFFAMLFYSVSRPHNFTKSAVVANHVWMLHSTVIYTAVGLAMCRDRELLSLVTDMSVDTDDPRSTAGAKIDIRYLSKHAWATALYVYIGALANLVAVTIAFFNGYFYDFFPVIKSDYWLGAMCFVWVFYSFGSVLSVPFVYTPTIMLLQRVSAFVQLLEAQGADDLLGDFDRFSTWYDNLYRANKRLNRQVGLLVTANIGLCAPLTVFELLIVVRGETHLLSGIIWVVLNTMLLVIVCGAAAQIEGQKNRVVFAIGQQNLSGRSDSTLIHYNCMLSKIDANPLGIYVYGTTLRISTNNILKVLSIVGSVFFFFVGLRV